MTTKRWLITGILLEGIISFIVYFPALVFELMGKGYLATQGCETLYVMGQATNACMTMYGVVGGVLLSGAFLIAAEYASQKGFTK